MAAVKKQAKAKADADEPRVVKRATKKKTAPWGKGRDITVGPDSMGRGWVVRRIGNTAATAVCDTKGAALRIAYDACLKEGPPSKVIVTEPKK